MNTHETNDAQAAIALQKIAAELRHTLRVETKSFRKWCHSYAGELDKIARALTAAEKPEAVVCWLPIPESRILPAGGYVFTSDPSDDWKACMKAITFPDYTGTYIVGWTHYMVLPKISHPAPVLTGETPRTCPVCDGGPGNDCACSCTTSLNTETPRTDAELAEICEGNQCFGYVRIGFARRLERELAAERAESDRLRKNIGCARNQGTTQFCHEAVDAKAEAERLRAELKGTAEQEKARAADLAIRCSNLDRLHDELAIERNKAIGNALAAESRDILAAENAKLRAVVAGVRTAWDAHLGPHKADVDGVDKFLREVEQLVIDQSHRGAAPDGIAQR